MPDVNQLGGVLDVHRPLAMEGPIASSDSIKTSSSSAGLGYAAGAGGAVTQITNKATAVTINKICGKITTHGASLAAGAEVGFTVNNSTVEVGDVVVICQRSGGTADTYTVTVDAVGAGSFRVSIGNYGSTLAETLVLNFAVIKTVSA